MLQRVDPDGDHKSARVATFAKHIESHGSAIPLTELGEAGSNALIEILEGDDLERCRAASRAAYNSNTSEATAFFHAQIEKGSLPVRFWLACGMGAASQANQFAPLTTPPLLEALNEGPPHLQAEVLQLCSRFKGRLSQHFVEGLKKSREENARKPWPILALLALFISEAEYRAPALALTNKKDVVGDIATILLVRGDSNHKVKKPRVMYVTKKAADLPHPWLRVAAIQCVRTAYSGLPSSPSRYVKFLTSMLKDEHHSVRAQANTSLASCKPMEKYQKQVAKAIKDNHPEVRITALGAAKSRAKEKVPAAVLSIYKKASKDEDPKVRSKAVFQHIVLTGTTKLALDVLKTETDQDVLLSIAGRYRSLSSTEEKKKLVEACSQIRNKRVITSILEEIRKANAASDHREVIERIAASTPYPRVRSAAQALLK